MSAHENRQVGIPPRPNHPGRARLRSGLAITAGVIVLFYAVVTGGEERSHYRRFKAEPMSPAWRSPWAGTRYVLYISFYRFSLQPDRIPCTITQAPIALAHADEIGTICPRHNAGSLDPMMKLCHDNGVQPRRLTYLGSPMRRHFVPASFLLLPLTALEGRLCADSHCA